MVKLSIIIPCYNHGHFIQEALDSIIINDTVSYEVIIVDDGSTDEFTINKLAELKAAGYHVISHPNHGLGYTRNAGIAASKGEYILPLDADNKAIPAFIYQALQVMDNQPYDIVYGKPVFFGDDLDYRKFMPGPFSACILLKGNYIDACAIFRKKVWADIGHYDENMPYQGNEDWEFWINAYSKGFKFLFLDTDGFYYRILEKSMAGQNMRPQEESDPNMQYVVGKHYKLYISMLEEEHYYASQHRNDIRHPFVAAKRFAKRTILKFLK